MLTSAVTAKRKVVTYRKQASRMASFGAVRHDREPLSNPYQTHDLCLVDLCPRESKEGGVQRIHHDYSDCQMFPGTDREGRLFGKWCIRDDIGKVGVRILLDIPNTEIPVNVFKGGRRLLANDVAKALFESVFKF